MSELQSGYQIDHLMIGVRDLREGSTWLTGMMGEPLTEGGRHLGQGTANALLGLTRDCYLEVIAPDPQSSKVEGLAKSLSVLSEPELRTFAVRCSGFEALIPVLMDQGFGYVRQEMSRETADGEQLHWELLFVRDHPYGQQMPFFIDWRDSTHPCRGLTASGDLSRLRVSIEHRIEDYRELMSVLDLPLDVVVGRPSLSASLETANGTVVLSSLASLSVG